MLTIIDIDRAIDRLGGAAFVPRTRLRRVASVVNGGRPSRESPPVQTAATRAGRVDSTSWGAASAAAEPGVVGRGEVLELEPVIILPEQLDDLGKRCQVPEHRLMLAVLEDAVAVYQAGCGSERLRGRQLFREAEAWFASDDTSSPFSFVTICQLFGIDPDYLRTGLRRWQPRHAERSLVGRPVSFAFRRISGTRHRVIAPRLRRGA